MYILLHRCKIQPNIWGGREGRGLDYTVILLFQLSRLDHETLVQVLLLFAVSLGTLMLGGHRCNDDTYVQTCIVS